MAIAQVSHASALDRVSLRHPLYCDSSGARRFESIALDGYDPATTKVTKHQSLFDFVAKKRSYAQATQAYRHDFWRHLQERNPKESKTRLWMDDQLAKGGLRWIDAVDEEHAEAIDLRVDSGTWFSTDDQASDGHAFADLGDAFTTLDGVLALLILYRKAMDLADNNANCLRQVLARASKVFAEKLCLEGEQRHTWELLVQTRILNWDPSFCPLVEDLADAERELLAERSGRSKCAGRLDSGPPEARVKGRAERRWRRQIMIYASYLSYMSSP